MPPLPFDLTRACADLSSAVLDAGELRPDALLIASRLFDDWRDFGVSPPLAKAWADLTLAFDDDAWNRLALLERLARETPIRSLVGVAIGGDRDRALRIFVQFVREEAKLLTLDLLRKSPFRVEEFARKWAWVLGAPIAGETPKQSEDRLLRIDFGGVLANLKVAEADRSERLRKLKELEDKRLKEQQEAYARASRE